MAEKQFRDRLIESPAEKYLEEFDRAQVMVEALFEGTVDLAQLEEYALVMLSDADRIDVIRNLAAPPISVEELVMLVEANFLAPHVLRNHPEYVRRVAQIIQTRLDRGCYPWVSEGRKPTPGERQAAVIATTTLIATQRAKSARRKTGRQAHKELIRRALLSTGMSEAAGPDDVIVSMFQAPKPGQFGQKIIIGTRKADFVVSLWDGRIMPIECAGSSSSLSSIDWTAWIYTLGTLNIIPTAVLSGVHRLYDLEEVQRRGMTIYWAHRLSDLTDWIDRTH